MALEVFLEARLAPKDSHLKVSLAKKALENIMFGKSMLQTKWRVEAIDSAQKVFVITSSIAD